MVVLLAAAFLIGKYSLKSCDSGENEISGDDFYGKLIFVLYTLDKGGKPFLIFISSDRDRYYYAGDNKFANVGSSSAFDSFAITLRLGNEKLTDLATTTKPTDYVQMKLIRF